MLLPSLLTVWALAGCGAKHEPSTQAAPNRPTASVRVQTVEKKSRTMTEEVVGTVRARLHATLEAKLSGRIDQLPVVLGDKVKKGQLILRLDAEEIAARLEQAEASLEQTERDWKRLSALYEQQSVTRAEYDSAQARQRVARAAVTEAKVMMSYVQITAPFDGVVTKKWAEVGDLATPGKPLIDLDDPSSLQLDADVPETVASQIRQDLRLTLRVDSLSNDLSGVVREIAPSADPASRTFRVKLDLPATAGLKPGQFARLEVPIGESSAVRVPVAAVVQRGQLEIVFTVADQHARLHLVKTGKRVGDEVEIISGLDAGSSVVINGAERLTDGQPVEVK